jgi:hypothetical protein
MLEKDFDAGLASLKRQVESAPPPAPTPPAESAGPTPTVPGPR